MSAERIWNDLNSEKDDDLSRLMDVAHLNRGQLKNPLQKIKRNLIINMIWGLLICIFYIFILANYSLIEVRICIGVVLLFSLWALYSALQQYKSIQPIVSPGLTLLEELQRQHAALTLWMRTQQRVALLIYPISAAGGFMLGGAIGSGKPVAMFMSKPGVIVILIIAIAILTPACFYFARWMFKLSFGHHLKDLEENISRLTEEK
jgi:hypothetical protein